jgi:hypothetical protein
MKPVAEDIVSLLDNELNLSFADNLFVNKEPLEPTNVVTIYSTSGAPTELTYDKKSIKNDNIQIRVRHSDPQLGWRLAIDIHDMLNGMSNVELVNSGYLINILCISGPFQLKFDEKGRIILVINFEVKRR